MHEISQLFALSFHFPISNMVIKTFQVEKESLSTHLIDPYVPIQGIESVRLQLSHDIHQAIYGSEMGHSESVAQQQIHQSIIYKQRYLSQCFSSIKRGRREKKKKKKKGRCRGRREGTGRRKRRKEGGRREGGNIPILIFSFFFFEANITLTPKPDKHNTKKKKITGQYSL